jgi:hypothetical protein
MSSTLRSSLRFATTAHQSPLVGESQLGPLNQETLAAFLGVMDDFPLGETTKTFANDEA